MLFAKISEEVFLLRETHFFVSVFFYRSIFRYFFPALKLYETT